MIHTCVHCEQEFAGLAIAGAGFGTTDHLHLYERAGRYAHVRCVSSVNHAEMDSYLTAYGR